MSIKLKEDVFKKIVSDIISNLPEEFLKKIDNVEFVIEDYPSPEVEDKFKTEGKKMLIGLYQGIPYRKRTRSYSFVLPDKITIYKSNIEKISSDIHALKKNLRHTIIHELAHYFGISDERLKELGVY